MLPPIYIINLERSIARRDAMACQLHGLDLTFTFIKAVDGHALEPTALPDYNMKKRRWYFDQDLTPSQLGCYLSHLRLMEKIAMERPTYAVILEDDVDIDDAFVDVLHAIGQLPATWDMIRLAGLRERRAQPLHQLTPQHTVARLLNTANGAHAYALTPRGASKLVAVARPIVRPIDIMMDRYWYNGIDILAVQPYVVRARFDVPSDMQRPTSSQSQTMSQWGKMRVKAYRRARKLKESLCKRVTNQWRRYRRVYEFEDYVELII
jgi:glycosyl transferase, family 25